MTRQFPCPVTTIFARRVRPGAEERYEEWLRGINQAAARFAGHQGVTVLRPDAGRAEYVVVAQFDSTDKVLTFRSTYSDPMSGQVITYREVNTTDSKDRFTYAAYTPVPGSGKEAKSMEIRYVRAGTAPSN